MNPRSLNTGVINIHGREYQTVALRIATFRQSYPSHSLTTEILHRDEEWVVMLAKVSDDAGRVIATGHAEEHRKASQINKTSAMENCETSAIGRALAAFGLGGTEFASADEIANALRQQSAPPQTQPTPKHNPKIVALINDAQTITALSDVWRDQLTPDERKAHADLKDKRKAELEKKAETDEFVAEMDAHAPA